MSEFTKVMNERGSIRAYKNEMLTDAEIKALVEAGLKAPTARNEQEIHITAVKTTNPVIKEIQDAFNPSASTTFYYNAPVLYFLSGADYFKWSSLDAGIAVENMHLAARDLGLGSLIIGCIDATMLGERKAEFNEKLGIPEGYSFRIALAAGYPDTEKEPHVIDIDKNANFIN